jgi:hypothetical protein
VKFQRTYTMAIQGETAIHVVSYPLTLELDVKRNTLASANTGHFRIRNLKLDTRRDIHKDQYTDLEYRSIVVQAGYLKESPLPTIFRGNISWAYSYRQGVDWITEIEAYDGGFDMETAQVSTTFPKGVDIKQVIQTLFGSFKHVAAGFISAANPNQSRSTTISGTSWDLLSKMASGQDASVFVDNERANFVKKDDVAPALGSITLIDADTGLLQTPRRQNLQLDAEILFEPRLAVFQRVQIKSLEPEFNGTYQVNGVAHRGIISETVSGQLVTTASLWLGTKALSTLGAAA